MFFFLLESCGSTEYTYTKTFGVKEPRKIILIDPNFSSYDYNEYIEAPIIESIRNKCPKVRIVRYEDFLKLVYPEFITPPFSPNDSIKMSRLAEVVDDTHLLFINTTKGKAWKTIDFYPNEEERREKNEASAYFELYDLSADTISYSMKATSRSSNIEIPIGKRNNRRIQTRTATSVLQGKAIRGGSKHLYVLIGCQEK